VRRFSKMMLTGALALAGGSLAWFAGSSQLFAADHFDPPARVDPAVNTTRPDIAADIADTYLFQDATNIYVSVDFGGPSATMLPAFYDRDVVYTVFLSNAGATTDAEFAIDIRFGQDPTKPGSNGVRIAGVPGTTAPIVGSVETMLTSGGVTAFAGLIDDPFNFDAVGLRDSRNTGVLSFMNTRNRFAGLNSTTVILAIPRAALVNGTNKIALWATAARIVAA
jgi:Domain of unknown function (DUF4331)